MTPQEQSAERLFLEALDLPAEQRYAFLDHACAQDPATRRLVDALLADHSSAGSFLNQPIFTPGPATGPPSAPGAALPRFHPGDLVAERFHVVIGVAQIYSLHWN